jgi:hypothetical protein
MGNAFLPASALQVRPPGNHTECGAAAVNGETGELDVATRQAVIVDMGTPFSWQEKLA